MGQVTLPLNRSCVLWNDRFSLWVKRPAAFVLMRQQFWVNVLENTGARSFAVLMKSDGLRTYNMRAKDGVLAAS